MVAFSANGSPAIQQRLTSAQLLSNFSIIRHFAFHLCSQTPPPPPLTIQPSTAPNMLCKECRTLLRVFRAKPSPATSNQAPLQASARRGLSTAQRSQQRQPISHSLQTRQRHASSVIIPLVATRTTSTGSPRLSSSFHTSATRQRPEAAADQEPNASSTAGLEKPDFLNDAESEIWDRLVREFDPAELVVQDISGGCGSMYGIEISSAKFRGANMLKQQRMVNAVLGDLMKGWHGCQLKTKVA